jgi:serine/threonine-protein kinase RsbW
MHWLLPATPGQVGSPAQCAARDRLHEEVGTRRRANRHPAVVERQNVTDESMTSVTSATGRMISADDQLQERGHRLATAVQPASTAVADGAARDEVTVRLPADGAYLSVLRTATAGLAARLDFTLDEIEDMRIAVDEACAMLLTQAIPGSALDCSFTLGQETMTVCVSVRCLAPRAPSGDTFAWTVLCALAGSVDAQVGPGDLLTIMLRKSRDSSRSV